MDYRSTIIRNVEIPSTLPPMETLTELTGSIILKEVSLEEDDLRIEGDLLWRGYFEENEGECLWEGAEYFRETLSRPELRDGEITDIEPKILSLTGESLSESTYRLTFDVLWDSGSITSERKAEEPPKAEERPRAVTTPPKAPTETAEKPRRAKSEPVLTEKAPSLRESNEAPQCSRRKDEEKKTTDERKEIKKEAPPKPTAEKAEPERAPEEEKEDKEPEIKCCPYSKYCLRYYRTGEGDELERIAERFSLTVAKLKEVNHLDSNYPKAGSLLRIP